MKNKNNRKTCYGLSPCALHTCGIIFQKHTQTVDLGSLEGNTPPELAQTFNPCAPVHGIRMHAKKAYPKICLVRVCAKCGDINFKNSKIRPKLELRNTGLTDPKIITFRAGNCFHLQLSHYWAAAFTIQHPRERMH